MYSHEYDNTYSLLVSDNVYDIKFDTSLIWYRKGKKSVKETLIKLILHKMCFSLLWKIAKGKNKKK